MMDDSTRPRTTASIFDLDGYGDKNTQSIYDQFVDTMKTNEQKQLLHRITYVAGCVANKSDVATRIDQIEKNIGSQLQEEPFSGVLLVYPEFCVHVVESSMENLLEFLRQLEEISVLGEGQTLQHVKVLCLSHNIPARSYHQWYTKVMDIEGMNETTKSSDKVATIGGQDGQENSLTQAKDLLLNMLKLANFLTKTPMVNFKQVTDNLHEKAAQLLPRQDTVLEILESDEEALKSPGQFLKEYEQTTIVRMQGDYVWPMDANLFSYKFGYV